MTVEDIFGFIVVIIGAVAAIINAASKKKQQAQTQYPPVVNMPVQPQAAPAAKPASMSSMLPPREASPQTAQPTVHTHLEPDCDVHDASGSLNFRSLEGKDPCHEEQLPASRTSQPEQSDGPGLTLNWTGDNLVKAIVMQEVLTRPCQRRAR